MHKQASKQASVLDNYRGVIAWREISCSRGYVSHKVFAGSLCAYLEGGRCCSKLGGIDMIHGSTEEDSSSRYTCPCS